MTERTVFGENQLRLLTLLFLLFAALMLLVGVLANDQRQTLNQAERLNQLAALAPTYSTLIDELQKERGLSAGFIAGKGGKFDRLLPGQRLATDQARLAPLEGNGTFVKMPPELLEKVDVAAASLSRLDQIRQAVDDRDIPPDEMIGFYSATISDLLRVVRTIAMLSTDVGVSTTITAYTAFLQGKEHAGQELATGALGFALRQFPVGLQRAFLETTSKQDAYFAVFVDYASPEQAAYFLRTVTGSAVTEVDYMRRIALTRPTAGPNSAPQDAATTDDIDAQYWFDTISRKIDLLKSVEDRLSADLRGQALAIRSNARTLLLAYSAGTVFLAVVTVGLAAAAFVRMSQARKVVRAVWHQANYDALTGLPNRGLLDDRLSGALASARRNGTKVAILFLDLDKFKPVNDTLGHAVGDLLLQEVANSLRNSVRETDTVARIGGDEFVAVLTNVHGRDDAENVAEKIITRLSHPFTLRAHTVDIGCSIGIAMYPDDDDDLYRLMEKADAAMYQVKKDPNKRYGFVPVEVEEQRA